MDRDCLACRIVSGEEEIAGGIVLRTPRWVVDHCFGPLGVGTLIVKPVRHCLHVADLTAEEAAEMGPLLRRVSALVLEMTGADQTYVCLWSHAGWTPGHIHFVVQPSWNRYRDDYPSPGPGVQLAMFREGEAPPAAEVERFCHEARARLATVD